jgi:hypothetical protein
MMFIRKRRVIAALVGTSCLALTASASADSLPSTYKSDAAQSGYSGTPTASASADSLPSTYKSDAAQSGYAGTPNLAGTTSDPAQDHRSPDARDAAEGRGAFNAPEVTVVKLPQPAPSTDAGIDWGDAGIGAGTLLGVIALGLAGAATVMRRRTATAG